MELYLLNRFVYSMARVSCVVVIMFVSCAFKSNTLRQDHRPNSDELLRAINRPNYANMHSIGMIGVQRNVRCSI